MSPIAPRFALGIDIGSVSVKALLLDATRQVVFRRYTRHRGRPLETLIELLAGVEQEHPAETISACAATGSGAARFAEALGAVGVNEVIAQATATAALHPDVRTIIEIGGQDSKLILVTREDGRLGIEDVAMNSACAAGTGSFLDQQAARLSVSIEREFGELAKKSKNPPRVAGRCSVFAKSDMIHLQQQATPDYDIVAGLCYAMARNFKSNLGRGKDFAKPIAFQGGVAANIGVVGAFENILDLAPGELIIPEGFETTGAFGAILVALDENRPSEYRGVDALRPLLEREDDDDALPPLGFEGDPTSRHYIGQAVTSPAPGEKIPAYLGIDVGSISTNVVALDEAGNVLDKRYLMTAGRPLEAVRHGLAELAAAIGDRIEVLGCGTTGSGRYLTGDFVGADTVRNEITAQATAAAALDSEVDTIFEIGGQDSKYISLENGVVVDFEMNQVCAAGTGSFLEEQAEELGINIKGEFGECALACKTPARMGERCTVFMQSDIVQLSGRGVERDALAAGLAYSIVQNYLNRVVGDRRIGNHIFLQGGTMANGAVVAAFEKILDKHVIVPRHHDVTGAIGMALLARDYMRQHPGPSRFRGFDLSTRRYSVDPFVCESCSNNCEIRKVTLEGEEPLYYGSRCEKYNVGGLHGEKNAAGPDLFAERTRMLLADYIADEDVQVQRAGPSVGIPRALLTYELLPFWKSFFKLLGIPLTLSPVTTKRMIHRGVESLANEPCFPVKVAHGHALELLDKGVDYIFAPSVITMERDPGIECNSYVCPYVQTIPYTLRSALSLADDRLLRPVVRFDHGIGHAADDLTAMAGALRRTPSEIRRAAKRAYAVLEEFRERLLERGREVLSTSNGKDGRLVVIVGRPYNTGDPGLNLDLPKKLRGLGVCPIPLDMLPVTDVDITDDFPNMYWKYGQRILRAARFVREHPRLSAIYVSNFSCGPDSFICSFFKKAMGNKPYLQLEFDEHSADAGVITRCEAFLDSLAAAGERQYTFPERIFKGNGNGHGNGYHFRKIYVPLMCEHAHVIAASFRAFGIDAEMMPESDDKSLAIGRRYTTGKECVPCVVTAGDMIRQIEAVGAAPGEVAFFMPSGTGPCRFGNYNLLHRMVLQEYGHEATPIFAPDLDTNVYAHLKTQNGNLMRPAWQGIVCMDVLEKLLYAWRPYEREPGEMDRAFGEWRDAVCRAIEERADLLPVMRAAAQAWRALDPGPHDPRPVIGIVGEIYVRNHGFSNQQLVRRLERMGAEVRMPAFQEWILYTNETRLWHCRRHRKLRDYASDWIKQRVQHADAVRLTRPFAGMLPHLFEPPVRHTLDRGNRYLHESFEGEAILSVGKAVEMVHEGASGIINVMPLTCMPGTIVTAQLRKMREDLGNVPALSVAYDGSEQPNLETRLEAFVHQARQWKGNRTSAHAHTVSG